jgi:hypothetical protein
MSGEAIVAKIDKVEEIPGANTIQVGYVLGERVIIGKDVTVGTVGIYFPAETQLSHEYCHENNLYRHSDRNKDTTKKGFFEDNRKVKAMKFMKVKSEGYFADLRSLWYTTDSTSTRMEDYWRLKVGDRFTKLDNFEICRKFISEHTRKAMGQQRKPKHIETPLFKQHVDTEQFKYFADRIPVGATLSFHAKLHGTSARYSHTLVKRQPRNFKERLLSKLGLFKAESWEYVAGTRRVVLWEDDHQKQGFNGPESWRLEWLEKLKPFLDRGVTVYGEIVGYANGAPIMAPHDVTKLGDKRYEEKYGKRIVYKYGCPEGTNRFIIYRVTYTTPDGNEIDLTVDQLKHWCEIRGLECTRELAQRHVLYVPESRESAQIIVRNLTDEESSCDVDWYDPSHIREGIVIRVDYKDTTPTFYKNKCYAFKVLEGIANETTVDLEDAS